MGSTRIVKSKNLAMKNPDLIPDEISLRRPDQAVTTRDISAWEALVVRVADGSIFHQEAAARLVELITPRA
jgi:hypothetical protein